MIFSIETIEQIAKMNKEQLVELEQKCKKALALRQAVESDVDATVREVSRHVVAILQLVKEARKNKAWILSRERVYAELAKLYQRNIVKESKLVEHWTVRSLKRKKQEVGNSVEILQ